MKEPGPKAESSMDHSPAVMRERRIALIVLSGAFVLFLVFAIVLEWKSNSRFSSTATDLEQRLIQGRMPRATLKDLLRGAPSESEHTSDNKERELRLRWPSFFRTYELRLVLDESDPTTEFIKRIETPFAAARSSGPIATGPSIAPLIPQARGLPTGYENIVALKVRDIPLASGSLVRELIRQGLLISAEEELGVGTIDASLGQVIPDADNPASSPLELDVEFAQTQVPVPESKGPWQELYSNLIIRISRRKSDGKWSDWTAPIEMVRYRHRIESLADTIGKLSLGPFKEGLEAVGFEKASASARATTEPIVAIPDHLDLCSQFALIRQLHSENGTQGSTLEREGALVRAYANLGSLSDFHWNVSHKVFHARSLIYANRLIAKSGKTPFTLSHQAYARALCGLHLAALESVQAARKASGPAAPEWLDLIEAYCAYQPRQLEAITGPQQELALYLRMRMVDLMMDHQSAIKAISSFIEINPACMRSMEMYGSVKTLGIQRLVSSLGYQATWHQIYSRIAKLDSLPSEARQIADAAAKNAADNQTLEFRTRMQLIDALRKSKRNPQNRNSFEWDGLAEMLHDESIIEAWRKLEFNATWLGQSTDEILGQVRPLLKGHRFEKFFDTYRSDPLPNREECETWVNSLSVVYREATAMPIGHRLSRSFVTPPQTNFTKPPPVDLGGVFLGTIIPHSDQTYEDVFRWHDWKFHPSHAILLYEISEHWPQSVYGVIDKLWDEVQDEVLTWETNFSESPLVLNALAQKYRDHLRLEDAQRCWQKSIAASPNQVAYRGIAEIFRVTGQLDRWEQTLDDALELPSLGLEGSQIKMEIANFKIRRGDFERAEPYADGAASSHSSGGLKVGAVCAEGQQKWDKSESYHQSNSQSYKRQQTDWYLWCVRTGRGDVDAARLLARKYWSSLVPPFSNEQFWSRAVGETLEGNHIEARKILVDCFNRDLDLAAAVVAAVFADRDGDQAQRDALFKEVETNWVRENNFAQLSNLFRRVLAGRKWSQNEFEMIVFNAAEGEIPHLYYIAGLFLARHNEAETADDYLQIAATGLDISCTAEAMASYELRSQGKSVNPMRIHLLPDSIASLTSDLDNIQSVSAQSERDQVLSHFNDILKRRSDFLPALIQRARIYESRLEFDKALADYETALGIDPDFSVTHNNLAWLFAGCPDDKIRNGQNALKHSTLNSKQWMFPTRYTMALQAAAEAENGHFDKAVDLQRQAMRMPGSDHDQNDRLKLYEAGRPYRRKLESDKKENDNPNRIRFN